MSAAFLRSWLSGDGMATQPGISEICPCHFWQGRISEATGEVDGPCTNASEASNERCISAVLAVS